MASGPKHDIEQLNSLIEVTLNSAQGYVAAADEAKSSRFAALFRERGAQRRDMAQRLQARVKSLGGEAEKNGTAMGAAERWFANLRQKMSGTDATIIAEVEAGEDHIKEAYRRVITDGELSDPVRTGLESEFAQIEADHEKMHDLKGVAA
jgi:uncharacterized protein (TIGR02284 family)